MSEEKKLSLPCKRRRPGDWTTRPERWQPPLLDAVLIRTGTKPPSITGSTHAVPPARSSREKGGRKSDARLRRNLKDAQYVHLLFLYIWYQTRFNTNVREAKRWLSREFATGFDGSRPQQRADAAAPYKREIAKRKRSGEAGGKVIPIDISHFLSKANRLLEGWSPFEAKDDLRDWFGKVDPITLNSSDALEEAVRVEAANHLKTIRLITHALARADHLYRRMAKTRSEMDQWTALDFGSRKKKLHDEAKLPDTKNSSNLVSVSLHDAFVVATTAWINPAELWSRYDPYRDVFDVAIFVGRLRHGYPIRMPRHLFGVLLSLIATLQVPGHAPLRHVDELCGASPPPRVPKEMRKHHGYVVRDLRAMMKAVLYSDYLTVIKSRSARWKAGEQFICIEPFKLRDERIRRKKHDEGANFPMSVFGLTD